MRKKVRDHSWNCMITLQPDMFINSQILIKKGVVLDI